MEPSGASSASGSGGGNGGGNGRRPRRAVLSAPQLSRKRELDRAKKRVNRAEYKNRLEAIESDVSHMRETIGELVRHLRQGKTIADLAHLPPVAQASSAVEDMGGQLRSLQDSPGSSELSDSDDAASPINGGEGSMQWQQSHTLSRTAHDFYAPNSHHPPNQRLNTQRPIASAKSATADVETEALPCGIDHLPAAAANDVNRSASWWHPKGEAEQIANVSWRLAWRRSLGRFEPS